MITKYLRVTEKPNGELMSGNAVVGWASTFGDRLLEKEDVAKDNLYTRKDGSQILVQEMDTRHLIYAYAKAVRDDENGEDRTAVLNMLRGEIERRIYKN